MNLESLFNKAFNEYGITEEQIKSKSRKPSIITVKNILICYLVTQRGFNLKKVAEEFNLHRTSVIHILKQTELYEDEFKLFKDVEIINDDSKSDEDIIKEALKLHPSEELKEYLLNYVI
ncbi:MAG: hypothetical protein [Caudoviricetes sp.]|nr:MAG: hypothetical protein [Caudoviricetes sp.]